MSFNFYASGNLDDQILTAIKVGLDITILRDLICTKGWLNYDKL